MSKFGDWLKRTMFEDVSAESSSVELDDVLLKALLGGEQITREKAMTLPAVSSAVSLISNIIATMPVKLYKRKQGIISEVERDPRVSFLNGNTGDTVNAFQLKTKLVEDYLLDKGGYAVIERRRNDVTGVYYVEPSRVTVYKNADPVHKYVRFQINTKYYDD